MMPLRLVVVLQLNSFVSPCCEGSFEIELEKHAEALAAWPEDNTLYQKILYHTLILPGTPETDAVCQPCWCHVCHVPKCKDVGGKRLWRALVDGRQGHVGRRASCGQVDGLLSCLVVDL